jgi:hypothetical protein
MTLRDRMVYAGIQTSRRMARLSWFERDVFRSLIHVADDYGRFEADPELLRSVLYGPCLAKVSVRDVQGALMRLAQTDIGLVKLYTVRGRGYGKVNNFRQTLQKRRALYPQDEDDPPPADLFTEVASSFFSAEGKKEEKSPQSPPAGGLPSNLSGLEKPKTRRRRSPERALAASRDELVQVEREMEEILRPGGVAYNIQPEGEKLTRFNKLAEQRQELLKIVKSAKAELREEQQES